MSEAVIQVRGLGKRYRVGTRERYLALRDVLTRVFTAPFRRGNGAAPEHIWALRDVSLDVEQGEVVGLIGRNGAGKTTLLKLLARITRPTEGYAEIRGRVGSLLEVGTGFHPELTGRENVYLSGAILGMKKIEIDRKFDEIVAFSEVERFLDTPLKHYSSGMQMRLAFAVAAHLEPEILLVDEVLAVGDINFQKKCLGKMEEVSKSGRTIVFVSHQLNQIRRLCERVYWLDDGRVRMVGGSHEVVSAYEAAANRSEPTRDRQPVGNSTKARYLRWEISRPTVDDAHTLTDLGPVTITITVDVRTPIPIAIHGIALYDCNRQLIWAWATEKFKLERGEHHLSHTFPMLPLRPGRYEWLTTLYDDGDLVDWWHCVPEMIVATENYQSAFDQWNGILNMPDQFEISAGVDSLLAEDKAGG
ncbi:MAG TPA: polysaccharide ABC transporter ATP-binding protein [Candidatus Sulfotelmatobacter sp.]|nr:polysaccharide ABC transporter ATP-binding protein [Candidatus Sulfotelmatobacter sp.]